ncbi:hypothetical protein [Aminicella lysinilytica]|uniref:Uncharacterized protein n=1 Tax=Aminicella lysinilytica TaxID=433323 RepID=A0A4R6Q8K9_9FIRM|nr:hypothetical protein [Aminicella lysinilytica]TDP58470.1 hypothetical protein EV211_10769 [Aminicella lysinilytica]
MFILDWLTKTKEPTAEEIRQKRESDIQAFYSTYDYREFKEGDYQKINTILSDLACNEPELVMGLWNEILDKNLDIIHKGEGPDGALHHLTMGILTCLTTSFASKKVIPLLLSDEEFLKEIISTTTSFSYSERCLGIMIDAALKNYDFQKANMILGWICDNKEAMVDTSMPKLIYAMEEVLTYEGEPKNVADYWQRQMVLNYAANLKADIEKEQDALADSRNDIPVSSNYVPDVGFPSTIPAFAYDDTALDSDEQEGYDIFDYRINENLDEAMWDPDSDECGLTGVYTDDNYFGDEWDLNRDLNFDGKNDLP